MRTSERFIRRLVVPVIITGLVAMAFYYTAMISLGESADRAKSAEAPTAEAKGAADDTEADEARQLASGELKSLEETLTNLDERVERLGQSDAVEDDAEAARQKLEELATIDPVDSEQKWQETRAQAFQRVREYATAVGHAERSAQ